MSSDRVTYRVATDDDFDAVLDCLRKFYYPEEPITIGNEPLQQSAEDEHFSMASLGSGASIVAELASGEVVGAVLAGAIEPGDVEVMLDEARVCPSRKWSEILLLLAHLEAKADVCRRYGVPRSLHMHALGVDPKLRGRGIAGTIMEHCLEAGKRNGYRLASTDCTSVYSIRCAQRIGMECIETLEFADYRDATGRQVFSPPYPHTTIQTFIKRL